jgi:hypothetical protein
MLNKTKFRKLKRDVKKALYNETMVDQWDDVKEILNDYYHNHLASEKERRTYGIKSMYKMHRLLKKCNITGLAEDVIESRHRRDDIIGREER